MYAKASLFKSVIGHCLSANITVHIELCIFQQFKPQQKLTILLIDKILNISLELKACKHYEFGYASMCLISLCDSKVTELRLYKKCLRVLGNERS